MWLRLLFGVGIGSAVGFLLEAIVQPQHSARLIIGGFVLFCISLLGHFGTKYDWALSHPDYQVERKYREQVGCAFLISLSTLIFFGVGLVTEFRPLSFIFPLGFAIIGGLWGAGSQSLVQIGHKVAKAFHWTKDTVETLFIVGILLWLVACFVGFLLWMLGLL
jgi:hypothetical protein